MPRRIVFLIFLCVALFSLALMAGENTSAQQGTPEPTAAATLPPTPAPSVNQNTAWFSQTTLYSLFVRSFRDSNADGVGDLQGVIDGLDYLQSLGVETIWLLPVWESPSYHGYDVINYYQVKAEYGTSEDLTRLIKAAHDRKMKILLDYVMNHTSNQHPNFKDAYANPKSKYSEFYRWKNAGQTSYEGFANLDFMPRLNFGSAAMRQWAIDIALYWMDPNKDGDFSDGVDGFRCDVAGDIPPDFWAQLRAAMNQVNPRAILLGEVWADGNKIVSYMGGNGLDAAFDFPVYSAFSGPNPQSNGDGAVSGKGDAQGISLMMRAMSRRIAPNTVMVRFTHNHDTNRLMSEVAGDLARARAAAVWLLTVPGVPVLYYGEEIGMKGNKGSGPVYYDEFRREPMDWFASEAGVYMTSWFKPNNRNNQPGDGISVQEQDGDPKSLLSLYRQLGKLRDESAALRGRNAEIPNSGRLYVAQRWSDQELLVVVINFSGSVQPYDNLDALAAVGGLTFKLDSRAEIAQQGVKLDAGELSLEPAGYVIYRLTR